MDNNLDQPKSIMEGINKMRGKEPVFFNMYYLVCFWLGVVLLNPIFGYFEYDVNPDTGKEELMYTGSIVLQILAGVIGLIAGYVLIIVYANDDPRLINPHLSLRYAKMKARLVESVAKATPFIFFFSAGLTIGLSAAIWALIISGIVASVVSLGYFYYKTMAH